ncbi:MAG: YitT family protein [Lentimicrobiaceae bacterium]|nr:YitT family protein [Lentimicrobiaceae bacterium]MCO5264450.1 YitT family protein [Lentimicrobium sp.]HPG34124.1 YitT family protein [Lentimicrobium sp.]
MAFLQKEKLFTKKWFIAYSLIIAGTLIVSVGYVYFIVPYKIVPGGIYGISIVLHHLLGLPVGMTALAFNIPLTIIGTRILGPRFGAKTVTGFISTSVFVDVLSYFSELKPLVENDPLLSSIFGGALVGVGVGLIFKSKATSGGSDVIAMILAKYTHLPLGQLMMGVDSVIVLFGFIAFGDWRIPLYSWITIFVMGKVIDAVLSGVSYEKTILIVSDKHEAIRDKIINDLNRGGTFLNGEGMYNGTSKKVIFTVVNRRELAMLEEFINKTDPKAFVTVMDANEILGQGFKSLKDKLED